MVALEPDPVARANRNLPFGRSTDPRLARWQDRLEGPWGWIGRGCRPNRNTTAELHRARFEIIDLEAYEAPGYPPIVRPHVIGLASPR